jgi:N-acylneuraminate cytidylyltransferase
MKIAIIPARGGSKRIPGKNIKNFLGVPVITYSIKAALQSGLFDVVMVSTDDPKIAETAKAAGAEVPFMRSPKNSGDLSGTTDVLLEVLHEYEKRSQHFSHGFCIYPCAPFVNAEVLNETFRKASAENLDFIFPVVKYSTPIQRAFKIKEGRVKMFYPEYLNSRSQDLEPAYFDAGQFYFFNTEALLRERKMLTDNTSVIVIDDMYAQDIDNETDWRLAELKYRMNTAK